MRNLFIILLVVCSLSIKAQSPQNKEGSHKMVVITDKMKSDFAAKQKLNEQDANASKVQPPTAPPVLTKEDSAVIRAKKAEYLLTHKPSNQNK